MLNIFYIHIRNVQDMSFCIIACGYKEVSYIFIARISNVKSVRFVLKKRNIN